MTPVKFAMLRDYPFPAADRNVWGLTYEAGEKCRLELDALGWLHIEQLGEHISVPPDLVRGVKHVGVLVTLAKLAELPPTLEVGIKSSTPTDVVEPATRPDHPRQDPNWKHPKAKR